MSSQMKNSPAAESLRPALLMPNSIASFTKTPSTRIRIFLKPHKFLCELAFRPHETSESAHRNRIFFKPLSRVDFLPSSQIHVDDRLKPDIFESTGDLRMPIGMY